jgi:hypothetical protein
MIRTAQVEATRHAGEQIVRRRPERCPHMADSARAAADSKVAAKPSAKQRARHWRRTAIVDRTVYAGRTFD